MFLLRLYREGIVGSVVFCIVVGAIHIFGYQDKFPLLAIVLALFITSLAILVPLSLVIVWPWRKFTEHHKLSWLWDAVPIAIATITYFVVFRPGYVEMVAATQHGRAIQADQHLGWTLGVLTGSVATSAMYFYDQIIARRRSERCFTDPVW